MTTATEAPPPAPAPDAPAPAPTRSFVARAFGVTALFSALGSILGLLRDLLLARFYGAGSATDAFLVAWTVPETAAPLLIEDGMAFLTVPAFSAALAARGKQGEQAVSGEAAAEAQEVDQVRALVAATLPPLALALALLSAVTAIGAPVLVRLLAPGLADPQLAVVCTRLTAVTVLPFGLTGYLSAGLRSHHRFTGPGAVYIAYNSGILGVMLLLHGSLGVRAAAGGVALGSLLMTAVLLPPFARHVSRLTWRRPRGAGAAGAATSGGPVLSPMALLPIVLFTLTRQSQIFVERFIGSTLPPGTISELNYAEKVAQNVMIIGILVCTVTFPMIARALAEGDVQRARQRVEADLSVVGAVVLAGTVVLVACAPQVVGVLFERGAFTAQDAAATASLMRVYSLGLLAQGLVGALIRPFLAARPAVGFGPGVAVDGTQRHTARPLDRTDWYPIAAMALGLLVNIVVAVGATPFVGALGLAAGNAAGISLTAVLLLHALRTRGIPVRTHTVLGGQLRLVLAAAGATVPAWLAANIPGVDAFGNLPPLLLGAVTGLLFFLALAGALRAPGVSDVLAGLRGRLASRPTVVRPRGAEIEHATGESDGC
ncbi:murein biosynthesis integral membrane protein MurJ [Streptacidiphilus sp. MAP5-3]|uniref:murein biosynthesis integral membrane protein MurJ n=1 Tax=unclassified Streptacidiphilus TaxID=2643834 RepID=UPI0035154447